MDQDRNASDQGGEGRTVEIEQRILKSAEYEAADELLALNFSPQSVDEYFKWLLKKHNMTQAEAVNRANLDKDYGAQIMSGKRGTCRDNYIRLGIAMGLDFHEMQSMLKFLRKGQIYVLRERDAAILFCVLRAYNLMDTQLMLDAHGFEPLGDGDFHVDDEMPIKDEARPVDTHEVEQYIKDAASFTEVLEKTAGKFIKGNIEKYFDQLLEKKKTQKKELFARTGISPNTGYQLLRGLRRSKNRDTYLKLAIAMGLNIDETQRMLKLLNVGVIYPVVERDYAIFYGMNQGYSLERMQAWLNERGFLPL